MAERAKPQSLGVTAHLILHSDGDSKRLDSSSSSSTGIVRPLHQMSTETENNAEQYGLDSKEEKIDRGMDSPLVNSSENLTQVDAGGRCNPDPNENIRAVEHTSLVAPAAVRISPNPAPNVTRKNVQAGEKNMGTIGASESQVLRVVRPRPIKTDASAGAALVPATVAETRAPKGKLLRETESGPETKTRKSRAQLQQGEANERHTVEEKTQQQLEARKRHDAQIDFPRIGNSQQVAAGRDPGPVASPGDGAGHQPPTRHVQYANAKDHAAGRPHRSRQQSRGSSKGTPSFGRKQPRGLSAGSAVGDSGSEHSQTMPLTPLFDRLVTEEVQERKALKSLIQKQYARLVELEADLQDIQGSFEQEMRNKVELERILAEREREWSERYASLEKERDNMEQEVKEEKANTENWRAQAKRKGKEVNDLIQKLKQTPGFHTYSTRNARQFGSSERPSNSPVTLQGTKTSPSGSTEHRLKQHRSPQDYFATSGTVETVRARNVTNSLRDFFGM